MVQRRTSSGVGGPLHLVEKEDVVGLKSDSDARSDFVSLVDDVICGSLREAGRRWSRSFAHGLLMGLGFYKPF